MARAREEVLRSDLSTIDKIWELVRDREDLGQGSYGVVTNDLERYERNGPCCCVVGAVLDGMPSTRDYQRDFAELLGVSVNWTMGLISGFDEDPYEDHCPESWSRGYVAGQEICRRLAERGVRL